MENNSRLLPADQVSKISRLLDRLDAAENIQDVNLPGFGLHQLKSDRKGYWSIRVSGNWRITFSFEGSHAYEVNLEDYHK